MDIRKIILVTLSLIFAITTTPLRAFAGYGATFPASQIIVGLHHGSYVVADVGKCTSWKSFKTVTSLDTGPFDPATWSARDCTSDGRGVRMGMPTFFVLWVLNVACYVPNRPAEEGQCIANYFSPANWAVEAKR